MELVDFIPIAVYLHEIAAAQVREIIIQGLDVDAVLVNLDLLAEIVVAPVFTVDFQLYVFASYGVRKPGLL
jgi:hypothetical protein